MPRIKTTTDAETTPRIFTKDQLRALQDHGFKQGSLKFAIEDRDSSLERLEKTEAAVEKAQADLVESERVLASLFKT